MIKVDLTDSRIQELRDEIAVARKSLEIPRELDGLYCAIWSPPRGTISTNERILARGYDIIEVDNE